MSVLVRPSVSDSSGLGGVILKPDVHGHAAVVKEFTLLPDLQKGSNYILWCSVYV